MAEIRFSKRDVGGLRLNTAEAGPPDGPLVILLHGFPEFWFGWRGQIEALAEAGFHVIAPDQRGYNLSDKPKGAAAYSLNNLAQDVLGLASALGVRRFDLVGHDWGAAVAWWVATEHPERLKRLAILNAPHPAIWLDAMTNDPVQRRKSAYVRMLRLPWLPEALMRASNFKALAGAFASARPGAYTQADLDLYRQAWSQPGALTGSINWYRALFLAPLATPAPGSLVPETLVLWGDQDAYAEPALAEASAALCARATVRHFPNASHWLAHDEPQAVAAALREFLTSGPEGVAP